MENFTDYIHIRNFKSLKRVDIEDCKRINLFVGKPNVGKSNLLEAISLFSLPNIRYNSKKTLQQFVRVENDSELFFDGNIHDTIEVESNIERVEIEIRSYALLMNFSGMYFKPRVSVYFSNFEPSFKGSDIFRPVPYKSYFFPTSFGDEKSSVSFLLPPNGVNLMSVVSQLPILKDELKDIFSSYGLRYAFDTNSQEIKIIKEKESGDIFMIPFQSIADTLQRLIFYKAAIYSNTNSILTFEEPEANAYPPYISKMTQSIIDSETNQFFITTHSPYVVTDFLENAIDELAIYMVGYEDDQTVVKRLSDEELKDVYAYGVDLFFNTETYLK